MSKNALIIGGTRGIGKALAERLRAGGWDVRATGRATLDLLKPEEWERALPLTDQYDLLVFSAGELRPAPWQIKTLDDLVRSYVVHAAAPVAMLAKYGDKLLGWWGKVVFISTVGAVNTGAVALDYGMSKAALEKAAKALEEHTPWRITVMRFDLVDTNMIRLLPDDSMHGRPIISVAEAAEQIIAAARLEE